MRRVFSLNQRLLVTLIVVSFAYWGVIAWITVRDSVDEVYGLFDAHLVHTAMALLRVADPDDIDLLDIPDNVESPPLREIFNQWPELPVRLAKSRNEDGATPRLEVSPALPSRANGSVHALHEEYDSKLRFQIRGADGQLLLKSANAPLAVITDKNGFSETTDASGQTWRHYGVWDMHRHIHILVSEAHDVRNRLIRHIAEHVASPLALGLPVLVFLLWFSINRGLAPLVVLTREIGRRRPESLAPLDPVGAPREVRPMLLALNDLLGRVSDSLESERRFTANAAHELRTPLAAIQAQLHVARAAEHEAERTHSMDQLQRCVERSIRLIGQLLTLARLDPEQTLPDVQPVKLAEVVETVCAELAPLALQRDQELELHVGPDLPILSGNGDMLAMLLCNLLDNGIRYTPSHGHVRVAVKKDDAGLLMEVSDDGPGIPPDLRERVFDRFYRIVGQDQPGTGLGLAICHRIAELHHARMVLADGPDGRGLTVRVFLPVSQAG